MTLPGLVLGLIALGVFELVRSRANHRPRTGSAAAGFAALEGILAPAKVHEIEERQRIDLMRDDVDDGAPPFSRIDLEQGRARLVVTAKPTEPDQR
jgi:hypothetical protein